MNSSHDEPALQVYRDAMPGYEVIGVSGTYSAPWESTDALHCRTHEVPDSGMLHIAHQPLSGMQPALEEYVFNADISAFSGAELYADSLYIRYRINSEDWQYLGLAHQSAMHYSGILDSFSVGDTIRYFIHAADQSGRSADHPVFAGLDPHLFVVEGDASAPELVHYPLTGIGNEETTFLLVASDDSGINSTGISYRIDQGEIISDAMLDAGNGIYLYPYDPQFYSGDQFFYYRLFAEDTFGNIA